MAGKRKAMPKVGTVLQSVHVAYVLGEVHCYCLLLECCCAKGAYDLRESIQRTCRGPHLDFTVESVSISHVHGYASTVIRGANNPPTPSLLARHESQGRLLKEKTPPIGESVTVPCEGNHTDPCRLTPSSGFFLEDAPPHLEELCPICQVEPLSAHAVVTTLCQHHFHLACYAKLAEKSAHPGCPICRLSLYDSLRNVHCEECGTSFDLWTCLICGYVGCGKNLSTASPEQGRKTNTEWFPPPLQRNEEGQPPPMAIALPITTPSTTNREDGGTAASHYIQHFHQTGHSAAIQCGSHRIWDHHTHTFFHQQVGMALLHAEAQARQRRRQGLRSYATTPPPSSFVAVLGEAEDLAAAVALEEEGRLASLRDDEEEDFEEEDDREADPFRTVALLDWGAAPLGENDLQRACRLQAEEEAVVMKPSTASPSSFSPIHSSSSTTTATNLHPIGGGAVPGASSLHECRTRLVTEHYQALFQRLRAEQWQWYNSSAGRSEALSRLCRHWPARDVTRASLTQMGLFSSPSSSTKAKKKGLAALPPSLRLPKSSTSTEPKKETEEEEEEDASDEEMEEDDSLFTTYTSPQEETEGGGSGMDPNASEWVGYRFYRRCLTNFSAVFFRERAHRQKVEARWMTQLAHIVHDGLEKMDIVMALERTNDIVAGGKEERGGNSGGGGGEEEEGRRSSRLPHASRHAKKRYIRTAMLLAGQRREKQEKEEQLRVMEVQVQTATEKLKELRKKIHDVPRQYSVKIAEKKKEIEALQREVMEALNRA